MIFSLYGAIATHKLTSWLGGQLILPKTTLEESEKSIVVN